jgi:hypothetical protein
MDAVELIAEKLKIDEPARIALGKTLGRVMTSAYDDSRGLRDKVQVLRDAYKGVLKEKPLKWMSNVHIPLIGYMVNQAAVAIGESATSVTPMFDLEAREPEYDDFAARMEEELEFWITKTRFRSKAKMAVKESLITGQCWLRPGVRDTERGKESMQAQLMLKESISPESLDVEPDCRYIITEDMLLLPYTAPNFRSANGAFARTWLRWNDFVRAGQNGTFYQDAVEKVKLDWQKDHPVSQIHEQQEITESVPETMWQAKFECWEGIFRWTKPGDTTEKEWLILVYWSTDSPGDAVILKCTEYRQLYSDQWFFVPIVCEPQANSIWGLSMAEALQGCQAVMKATTDMSLDAICIGILPPIAITPGSEAYRKNIVWGPLEKWPLANPMTDVNMLGANASVMAGVQAAMGQTEFFRGMAERKSGVNDLRVGKQEPERRTAYEIRARMGAGSQIFEEQVATLQFGMEDDQGLEAYASMMLQILARYLPAVPITYRYGNGPNHWKTVDPAWRQGKYNIIPHGTTANANPEVQLNRAMATMEELKQSPFLAISPMDTPEAVLAKVQQMYKAESAFFQAIGHKRVDSYIGQEPQTIEEAMAIAAILNPMAASIIATRQLAKRGIVPGAPPMLGAGGEVAPPTLPQSAGGGNKPMADGQGEPATFGGGAGIPGANTEAGMVTV